MNISKTQTDKIVVGTNDVSYVPPDTSPTGTAVINGPVYIGKTSASPGYEANLNVASNAATQNPLDVNPAYQSSLAIKADGNLTVEGDGKTANALLISGGSSVDTIHVIGDMFVSGKVDCGNKGVLAARFAAADASPKPFDLEHPTKGKGHRLRYACIEGPEVGVYYRGRLKGKNIIELPYYWKDLVHEDSITVQLQPIGKDQNLVIESFNSEYIVIEVGANQDFLTNEILIDCFYHVYAERKDINPLITEYEGNSWEDYPDPNYNPNKVDSEKKNTKDPRFDGPPNTITK
tara:strand:+ start:3266 stop:4138 length:873 start_codon:yes stop_codon:yes gene_type:complete